MFIGDRKEKQGTHFWNTMIQRNDKYTVLCFYKSMVRGYKKYKMKIINPINERTGEPLKDITLANYLSLEKRFKSSFIIGKKFIKEMFQVNRIENIYDNKNSLSNRVERLVNTFAEMNRKLDILMNKSFENELSTVGNKNKVVSIDSYRKSKNLAF